MAEPVEYPVSLDLDSGRVTFSTDDDAINFARGEMQQWEWLGSNHVPNQVRDEFNSRFSTIRQRCESYRGLNDQDKVQWRRQIQEDILGLFRQDGAWFSTASVRGRFILKLKSEFNDAVAGGAAMWLLGKRERPGGVEIGVLFAWAYERGLELDTIKGANEQLYNHWQKEFQSANDQQAAKSAEHIAQLDKRCEELTTFVQEQQTHLKELERIYREIQMTKEPASYWKDRAEFHQKRAMWYSVVSIAAGIVGVGSLIWFSFSIQQRLSHLGATATLWTVLPRTFPVIVSAVALFWLMRVLVRLVLTNLHIAIDAAEREVLAKTYLALLEGKEELDAPARTIVLNQLFRHAATSLVKDDASPPIPAQFVTKD